MPRCMGRTGRGGGYDTGSLIGSPGIECECWGVASNIQQASGLRKATPAGRRGRLAGAGAEGIGSRSRNDRAISSAG
jgi:hypothetical protein